MALSQRDSLILFTAIIALIIAACALVLYTEYHDREPYGDDHERNAYDANAAQE